MGPLEMWMRVHHIKGRTNGFNILVITIFNILKKIKIMEIWTYRSKLHVFTKSATLLDQKHVKEKNKLKSFITKEIRRPMPP